MVHVSIAPNTFNAVMKHLRSSAWHRRSSAFPKILGCVFVMLASGCMVGPNYKKPEVEVPAAYKELEGWKIAEPKDSVPKGKWWELFKDPVLNGLMEQVNVSNQELRAAEARYRAARAQVSVARSGLFPTLGASANADRARRGDGQTVNTAVVTLDAGWEIDLWGRVRRTIEAADAGAQASAADLEAVRLLLQAELATNYFQLRVLDGGRELLEDAVKAYARSYQLTQNRYTAGVVSKADVVQAESQLRSTQAQEIDTRVTRATLENAIAVLIGKPPSALRIAPVPLAIALPGIPPGSPSTLLERRPDIAAAERRVAAANARIGVAQAAYYPTLSLDGRIGFTSNSFSHLFSLPNRTWSLGAALAGTLIDFGARSGQVSAAEASYDEAVANYRQAVLAGFQEVENNLATLHWLAEESSVQLEAMRAARESVTLTSNQYKAGTVSFLNVVIVQAAQLSEERAMVNIIGRRLAATVALIRAIGGDWEHP
jgi:NodT family efflux transporter outer membrane factor (OMF) lipoprotein